MYYHKESKTGYGNSKDMLNHVPNFKTNHNNTSFGTCYSFNIKIQKEGVETGNGIMFPHPDILSNLIIHYSWNKD